MKEFDDESAELRCIAFRFSSLLDGGILLAELRGDEERCSIVDPTSTEIRTGKRARGFPQNSRQRLTGAGLGWAMRSLIVAKLDVVNRTLRGCAIDERTYCWAISEGLNLRMFGDPRHLGFSSILPGTSIELFQKSNFPGISPHFRGKRPFLGQSILSEGRF
jgi:hypothetical protein